MHQGKHGKHLFFEAARRMGHLVLICLLAVGVVLPALAQNDTGTNTKLKYTGSDTGVMSHITFEGGGGFTPAAGGTANNVNVGWNILLGTGYMLNKRFGVLAEWNFNRNAIPQKILNTIPPSSLPPGYTLADVGGNYHFWTATLDPIYNYWMGSKWGGYLVGGGGFSRKLVSFTVPVCGYGYGYGFGYGFGGYGFPVCGNTPYAHFSSNQAVADLGTGFTYRFSPYGRTKLFVEARFDKLYTSQGQIPGRDAQLVPVVIGIRW